MTSFDEADQARIRVRVRLGWPPWVRSVVTAKDFGGSHYVRVTVAEEADRVRVPIEMDGVRVVTVVDL